MLAAVEALMERLKLPMNAEKTRCCRLPEESMTFLGYRIGRNYRPGEGAWELLARRKERAAVLECELASKPPAILHCKTTTSEWATAYRWNA